MPFEPIKEPFYKYYIGLVKEKSLIEAMENSANELVEFFNKIPVSKADYRYAEDKWSIKELLQHLIDTERIFVYRALTFLRQSNAVLPGYDHEAYVDELRLDHVTFEELIEEFSDVRRSTRSFYRNISPTELDRIGTANGNEMSVEAIGRIIVGHARHHMGIIESRYL